MTPVATPKYTQTCTQQHRRSHYAHKATRLEPTTDKSTGFRGNKTVNPLLTASAAQRGWPHIMQNERRDVGRLYHSNWPRGAGALSASQTPSYSMPVEHWFSTLLAHMIPSFLRGKLPGEKKKKKDSLWSIGPLRCWIQVTSGERWGEREGEDGDSAQWGCLHVSITEGKGTGYKTAIQQCTITCFAPFHHLIIIGEKKEPPRFAYNNQLLAAFISRVELHPPLESFRNCSLLEVINLAKHIPHLTPAYRFMWAGYTRHPAPKISPRYICESVIRDAHSSWLDTYLYATARYSRYFTH